MQPLPSPETLSPCHCMNIRRAALRVTELYDRCVQPAGITVQQFSLLRHIDALAPVTVTDLARVFLLDRTTLSRNIKTLEKRGLVADRSQGGRGKQLILTEQGQQTLAQAEALWDQAQAAFAQKLGPEQLDQWNELLERLLEKT